MPMLKASIVSAAYGLTARLPLPLLQRLNGRGPCVVLYHAVTNEAPDHLKHLLPCRDIAGFRRDLDFLLKHFEPITLAQLVRGAIGGEPLPANAFHLTCDDGLREAAEVIAPICREKGVPATFFLTTGFLDNRFLWKRHLGSLLFERIGHLPEVSRDSLRAAIQERHPVNVSASWKELLITRDQENRSFLDAVAELIGLDQAAYLRTNRPYLESGEVRRLIEAGFAIGAHSVSHPFFLSIPPEEQVRETTESLRQIEALFGVPCRAFAFPFGADGGRPEFFESVRRCHEVDLFFGVGSAGKLSADRLLDRISLDCPAEARGQNVLRRAYATRLGRRVRGIRADKIAVVGRERA